jgi:hypothetical protein
MISLQFNNLYLVVSAVSMIILITGLLWPSRFARAARVRAQDLMWLGVMTLFSWAMPGFTWAARGLVGACLAAHAARFAWQKRHGKRKGKA